MFWNRNKKVEVVNNDSEHELELKKKEVDLRVAQYEAEMQLKGNKQRNEYECQWHNEREAKQIQLAELDAKIKVRKENEDLRDKLIVEKDKQIVYLQGVISKLTDALAKQEHVKILDMK